MRAMEQREARHRLGGEGPVDDASLGSERPDGKAGRGSEHKLPFLAAVSSSEEGHPLRAKFSLVPGLTRKLLAEWARSPLVPGSTVRPAGLACCNAVSEAGGDHQPTVVDGRKLKERPEFKGGQHDPGQSQDPPFGLRPCACLPQVWCSRPHGFRLPIQPPFQSPMRSRDAQRAVPHRRSNLCATAPVRHPGG